MPSYTPFRDALPSGCYSPFHPFVGNIIGQLQEVVKAICIETDSIFQVVEGHTDSSLADPCNYPCADL